MDAPTRVDRSGRLTFWIATAAAVAVGIGAAAALWWTNDDAYISFRYADHLIRGLGLVFNPGERVEGYTNFLWTLWCALGMQLGAAPEIWANASGIVCFAATILVLAALTWTRRRSGLVVIPIAALGVALHREAAIFATGGLETPLFMLLITAGCAALTTVTLTPRCAALAGLLFGLAVLTRPDGVVPAALAGAWLLWESRARPKILVAYGGMLALVIAPWLAWKLSYYGELLPNTYFAKSANRAWWSQGLYYVGLYFAKYAALAAGLGAGILAWRALSTSRPREEPTAFGDTDLARRQLSLALIVSIGFIGYVARVGGDFMFARFLVPVAPLMLVALEIGIERLAPGRGERAAIGALALVLIVVARDPIVGMQGRRGIVNEREWYPAHERLEKRRAAESFAAMTRGLPIRVAFFGAQAIHAYYARMPVAIEAEAGLTDRFVARQPLGARKRVGHEKSAPWSYLVGTRRAHFALIEYPEDSLAAYVPLVLGRIGELPVVALTWDPTVMDALIRRGARFEEFPSRIDTMIARLPSLSDSAVRREYARLRRFYFAVANDPKRESPFRQRTSGDETSRTIVSHAGDPRSSP